MIGNLVTIWGVGTTVGDRIGLGPRCPSGGKLPRTGFDFKGEGKVSAMLTLYSKYPLSATLTSFASLLCRLFSLEASVEFLQARKQNEKLCCEVIKYFPPFNHSSLPRSLRSMHHRHASWSTSLSSLSSN